MKDGRGRQNQPAGGLCSAAAGDQVSRSPQVRRIRAQRMERRFTMVSDSQEKEVQQLEDEAAAEEEEGGCFLLCQQGRTEAT